MQIVGYQNTTNIENAMQHLNTNKHFMIVLFFVFFRCFVFWLRLWHLQTFLWKLILLKHVYVMTAGTKYQFLKCQWIFPFYVDFSSLSRTFYFTGLDYAYHGGCLIGSSNCLPFACILVLPRFYMASALLICSVFRVLCVLFSFLSMFCVLYPYLPVPLNGPILISTWLFLLTYIFEIKINNMKFFGPRWTIFFFVCYWLFELTYIRSAKYKSKQNIKMKIKD